MKKYIKISLLIIFSLLSVVIAGNKISEISLPDTLIVGKLNKEIIIIKEYRLLYVDIENIKITSTLSNKDWKYYLETNYVNANRLNKIKSDSGKVLIENKMLLNYRKSEYLGPDSVLQNNKQLLLSNIRIYGQEANLKEIGEGKYEINSKIKINEIDKKNILDTLFTKEVYIKKE